MRCSCLQHQLPTTVHKTPYLYKALAAFDASNNLTSTAKDQSEIRTQGVARCHIRFWAIYGPSNDTIWCDEWQRAIAFRRPQVFATVRIRHSHIPNSVSTPLRNGYNVNDLGCHWRL